MVKVSRVSETEKNEANNQTFAAEVHNLSDSESGLSDDDFDDDEDYDYLNETLYERIVALKEVVPPQYRSSVTGTLSSTYNAISSALTLSGKALWVITTSSILLGVPLSLSILGEQQLVEMEKEMKLNQSTNEVLAPGADSGFASPEVGKI